MAKPDNPATDQAPPDSPELAHFKFQEKELIDMGKKLDAHPKTQDHDIPAAKARNEMRLKQVRAEIKRLEKK